MTCPFLGMSGDSTTSLAFPSAWNHCHHCKPVAPVSLAHQRSHCLTGEYETCPVFLQSPNKALPRGLRMKLARPARKKALGIVVLVILAALAAMFIGWNSLIGGVPLSAPALSETPSPTMSLQPVSPTTTPSPQQTATFTIFTPFLLSTPNATHISQVTPIVTRKPHVIDDLIGTTYIFKVHRVQQGETIKELAILNSTTVAVIMEVNYKLQTPLWAGQAVVIPVNQMDVSALPQFEAYRLMDNITTEELASRLNVDPAQLRYYNGIGASEQFLIKEWILVPREKARKPHGIDEVIGVNFIFSIHRVRQSESVEMLAARYGITITSLTAVNYKLQTPLFPSQLIVIPGNQMDVSGLPQFEIYGVIENIATEQLAAQLNVDPAKLRYYNGLGTTEHFVKNEWIIVPREK